MLGNIFHRTSLDSYFTRIVQNLNAKIGSLKNVNLESDSAKLFDQFSLKPLVVHKYRIGQHVEGTESSRGPMGNSTFPTLTVSVNLPFDGDFNLFECTPSSSQIIYLEHPFSIRPDGLIFSLKFRGKLQDGAIQKEMDRIVREISGNIATINSEVEKFNNRLRGIINEQLQKRQERIDEINRFRGDA
jgi:hypothetical protein